MRLTRAARCQELLSAATALPDRGDLLAVAQGADRRDAAGSALRAARRLGPSVRTSQAAAAGRRALPLRMEGPLSASGHCQ